jgi:hypothetical protein
VETAAEELADPFRDPQALPALRTEVEMLVYVCFSLLAE